MKPVTKICADPCGQEKPRRPRRIGQRDKRRATTIERDNSPRAMARLTPQELVVVELLLAGHTTNKAIAERMAISRRTVQTHLSKAFDKLHICSTVELVLVAILEGVEVSATWEQLRDKKSA